MKTDWLNHAIFEQPNGSNGNDVNVTSRSYEIISASLQKTNVMTNNEDDLLQEKKYKRRLLRLSVKNEKKKAAKVRRVRKL